MPAGLHLIIIIIIVDFSHCSEPLSVDHV